MESYDENGMLTARGFAEWADEEGGMLYLLVGHGVDITEFQPALRDDVVEMERLGQAFEDAVTAFFTKHGGAL